MSGISVEVCVLFMIVLAQRLCGSLLLRIVCVARVVVGARAY